MPTRFSARSSGRCCRCARRRRNWVTTCSGRAHRKPRAARCGDNRFQPDQGSRRAHHPLLLVAELVNDVEQVVDRAGIQPIIHHDILELVIACGLHAPAVLRIDRIEHSMNSQPAARYPRMAVVLHWIVALLIIALLATGWYVVGTLKNTPERALFFNLHKSLGITTAFVILT